MKQLTVAVLLVFGLACTLAEESKESEVTKLEVVDLGEVSDQSDSKISESQRKRDSGYVYNRPDRVSAGQRFNRPGFGQNSNGYRGKILSRYPSQSQRPLNSYGAPLQIRPVIVRPSSQYGGPQNNNLGGSQNQFNGQQGHSNGHRNHQSQFSNQFKKPNSGYFSQEVPSPVRIVDFVEPSPIASQNNEPFGQNTANYLPPRNQELPTYSAPNTFGSDQQNFQQQNSQIQTQVQGPDSNFQAQNFAQSSNQGISDAANFLAQNAQAISQLYGAPATDQNFAPNNEEFLGQNNQIQGVFGPSSGQNSQLQDQQFQNPGQGSQGFSGVLPSYASGTLGSTESLEQIQSKEKDRLILQLQTLLSQSRSQNAANAELSGQYAQSHGNYIQNQNLLASISSQFQNQAKYNGQNNQNVPQLGLDSLGSANTAFGQAPFIPGTSPSPTYTLGYPLTTQQTPTTTSTTTTTTVSPIQPSQNPKEDGSSQSGTVVPRPTFPHYGGFVPSLIPGTNFVGNLPNYGTLGPSLIPSPSVQPADSTPTHFGLPIPQDPNAPQHPQVPESSVNHPAQHPAVGLPSSPTPIGRPVAFPAQPVQPIQPIYPVHPIHAIQPVHAVRPVHAVHPVHSVHPIAPLAPSVTQLQPVTTPVHGIQQFHPVVSSVQPISAPVHPILPTGPAVTPIHGAATAAHPTYGVQSAAFNPLLYKPIKTVYPVYYYPNLPYQVQKPALPTYPWSYAPSYAQAKPAQIWK